MAGLIAVSAIAFKWPVFSLPAMSLGLSFLFGRLGLSLDATLFVMGALGLAMVLILSAIHAH